MTFPSQPEALTEAWLSEALGYRVNAFRVETFGAGASIIGQVTRVHLSTDDAQKTIIAKFASAAPENRAVAATYGMYQREVEFYQRIAEQIALRVPVCYFSEINIESQDFVILMEDLQGMQVGDQVAGCSQDQAELVITALARFHASTWNTELPLVSHNNPAQRDGMMAGFGVGWPVVTAQFSEFVPANGDYLATAIPAAVPWLLDEMCQAPICVAHADVRLDNIFLGESEIALVDWQSVCTSAPEQDLAYFVTQSLSKEIRDSRDWVTLYHQELVAHGVTHYDFAQCRHRYRVCALYLACYATIIAGTLDLGNERGKKLGRTLFGNAMTALIDLDAFSLLDDQ